MKLDEAIEFFKTSWEDVLKASRESMDEDQPYFNDNIFVSKETLLSFIEKIKSLKFTIESSYEEKYCFNHNQFERGIVLSHEIFHDSANHEICIKISNYSFSQLFVSYYYFGNHIRDIYTLEQIKDLFKAITDIELSH